MPVLSHESGLADKRHDLNVKQFFGDQLLRLKCSPRTLDIYQRAHNKFFDFLNGENPALRKVTRKQVAEFYGDYLVETGLSESYRGKTAKIVREFFDKAVKLGLITSNPFDGTKITEPVDRSRHVYVDRTAIHQIIDSAEDTRWKCILGFAGLCGLRTRSEIAALRWENINWDSATFTIPEVKTKERSCPIFGDFREILEQYHQLCLGDDLLTVLSGPVFPNCPSQTQLTSRLKRTIAKAGLQPWVKPWQNLRSSCETWLLRQGFDLDVVTGWLGNSEAVANKHYLQITPHDLKAATHLKKFSNSFQNTGERQRTASSGNKKPRETTCFTGKKYTRRDSNPQPSVPKTDALSS